jgi:hypothetical protein
MPRKDRMFITPITGKYEIDFAHEEKESIRLWAGHKKTRHLETGDYFGYASWKTNKLYLHLVRHILFGPEAKQMARKHWRPNEYTVDSVIVLGPCIKIIEYSTFLTSQRIKIVRYRSMHRVSSHLLINQPSMDRI